MAFCFFCPVLTVDHRNSYMTVDVQSIITINTVARCLNYFNGTMSFQSMFSATEEHLVHLISSYLESQLFVSFISSLADLMSPSSLSSSKPMTSERSTVHFCSFVYNLNRLNSKSRLDEILSSIFELFIPSLRLCYK